MLLLTTIIVILISSINVFLHGFGIYLLVCSSRQKEIHVQTILLINLSASELIMNGLKLVISILTLTEHHVATPSQVSSLKEYLSMIMYTGVTYWFFSGMVYITVDRLLNAVLIIRYRFYCTKRKAEILLWLTWLISMLSCLPVIIGADYFNFHWLEFCFLYVFPTFDFGFILLAVITYSVLFMKYRRSTHSIEEHSDGETPRSKRRRSTSVQLFRRSRFIVSIYLIGTYLVFTVASDLTFLFVGVINNNTSKVLLTATKISFAISNMADAIIYVFMQKRIRKLFCKKLQSCCCTTLRNERPSVCVVCNSDQHHTQSTDF